MLEFIGLFGYIGLFWLTWKGLDWAYHRVRGDKVIHCSLCRRWEKEIESLRAKNAILLKEIEEYSRRAKQVEHYEHHVKDYRLIQQLNIANEAALEAIHGIGPKRARQIVQNRPFYTMQQVREILPEWLVTQARNRLSWRG